MRRWLTVMNATENDQDEAFAMPPSDAVSSHILKIYSNISMKYK